MTKINTIIFDLGGVLIDWNPRYLYRNIFKNDNEMEYFLSKICTTEWNEEQDAGRSFSQGTQILLDKNPEFSEEIKAYYGRWEEMLKGPIIETVELLNELVQSKKFKIYALTNWSAESFPVAQKKFKFLEQFDGIVVSGDEKMKKPDPKIFHLLSERYNIDPASSVFIDDNLKNTYAAQLLGFKTIHFIGIEDCKRCLYAYIEAALMM